MGLQREDPGCLREDGMKFYGYATDSLQTVNRIGVEIMPRLKILYPGDSLCLSVTFKNNYPYDINFNHKNFPVTVCIAFINRRRNKFISCGSERSGWNYPKW